MHRLGLGGLRVGGRNDNNGANSFEGTLFMRLFSRSSEPDGKMHTFSHPANVSGVNLL